MNTKRMFSPVLLILTLSLASSCSKDSDTEPVDKSRKELIIGSWTMSAAVTNPALSDYDGDGVKDADVFAHTDACDRDDFVTFKSDGSVVHDEGATKCRSNDPQITNDTWTMSSDEKTITTDGIVMTILELNATTLKISYNDTSYDGIKYTLTSTYTRK